MRAHDTTETPPNYASPFTLAHSHFSDFASSVIRHQQRLTSRYNATTHASLSNPFHGSAWDTNHTPELGVGSSGLLNWTAVDLDAVAGLGFIKGTLGPTGEGPEGTVGPAEGEEGIGTLESLTYSLPIMVLVALVLVVVIVVTAFGNLLVCLALLRYRCLRTVSNILIGNLAVSDFLLAVTVLPLSSTNECLGRWVFGRVLCNVWLIADVLYCTASIWNLAIIALDRYTATLYPLWYRERRSAAQAGLYIVLIWVVAAGAGVPPLLGWNDLTQNYVVDNATAVEKCVLFHTPSYVLYSAGVSFYVPFALTFFLYVRIFVVLRKRLQKMRGTAGSVRAGTQSQAAPAAAALCQTSAMNSNTNHTAECTKMENMGVALKTADDHQGAVKTKDESEEVSSKSALVSDSDLNSSDEEITYGVTELTSPNDAVAPDARSCESNSVQILNRHASGRPRTAGTQSMRVRERGTSVRAARVKRLNSEPCGKDSKPIDAVKPEEKPPLVPTAITTRQLPITTRHFTPNAANVPKTTTRSGSMRGGGSQRRRTGSRLGSRVDRSAKRCNSRRSERREIRATIRMAAIIGVFCGMWVGFFTMYVIGGWCPQCSVPRWLEAFFFWLGYANSTVNPILYTIFNDDFRKAFQKILGCYQQRGRGRSFRKR